MAVTQADLEREVGEIRHQIAKLGRPMTPEEKAIIRGKVGSIRERFADVVSQRLIDQRPEVLTHGRPVAGGAAKRGQEEARRWLLESEQFQKASSACPAAETWRQPDGSVAVRCGVERSKMSSRTDPQSLVSFCLGDHLACPSWRAERERLWEGRPELVDKTEGE